MTAIVSVCNQKGGAGKSTIAVNIACALALRGNRDCLLVDADRQGTAQAWAAKGSLPVSVIAAILSEAKSEERYPGMMWVTRMKSLADRHGTIVIDLPPGLECSLAAVTTISDVIVVPVNPSGIDFHATERFIQLIQKSREARRSTRPSCIIVPNRIDSRTRYAEDLSDYLRFGEPVAHAIHLRSAFVKCFDTGQWIGAVASGSPAHREIELLADLIDTLEPTVDRDVAIRWLERGVARSNAVDTVPPTTN